MRIVVLDANYPREDNLYGDVFVHVRVARYIALGHQVRVISFFTDRPAFTFDGVSVSCANNVEALRHLVAEFEPDVIAIHFFQGWMLKKIIAQTKTPVVIWVHGIEALGWYRRLFNFEISREFWHYVKYAVIQQVRFARLLRYARNSRDRIQFIFVSNWMKRAAEVDALTAVHEAHVIPNPIDTERFPYLPKGASLRTRVLLIRSFDSRKYANDIAIDAIIRMSRLPEFEAFTFSIYGRGKLLEDLVRPLGNLRNVTVTEGYLTQSQIRELHASHGVLLCPTRQDAQGVTMCEAMSSGLVPISSWSTAIPEFVTDGETGFLTNGSRGIVEALLRLHGDPALFLRMSAAAATDIREKAGIDSVVPRELTVLESAARSQC